LHQPTPRSAAVPLPPSPPRPSSRLSSSSITSDDSTYSTWSSSSSSTSSSPSRSRSARRSRSRSSFNTAAILSPPKISTPCECQLIRLKQMMHRDLLAQLFIRRFKAIKRLVRNDVDLVGRIRRVVEALSSGETNLASVWGEAGLVQMLNSSPTPQQQQQEQQTQQPSDPSTNNNTTTTSPETPTRASSVSLEIIYNGQVRNVVEEADERRSPPRNSRSHTRSTSTTASDSTSTSSHTSLPSSPTRSSTGSTGSTGEGDEHGQSFVLMNEHHAQEILSELERIQ
ncbi:hypothetical protein HK102_011874, partial [Quaeritorhiza haematococci]